MQPKQLDTGLSQALRGVATMKFGLRFALLAQTKCQNMAPRLSRVTRLSTSSPSYDYASEDCTVVFDADGVALRGHELSTCIRAHHLDVRLARRRQL